MYLTSSATSSSFRSPSHEGILSERPSAGPPFEITSLSCPSVLFVINAESVRSLGLTPFLRKEEGGHRTITLSIPSVAYGAVSKVEQFRCLSRLRLFSLFFNPLGPVAFIAYVHLRCEARNNICNLVKPDVASQAGDTPVIMGLVVAYEVCVEPPPSVRQGPPFRIRGMACLACTGHAPVLLFGSGGIDVAYLAGVFVLRYFFEWFIGESVPLRDQIIVNLSAGRRLPVAEDAFYSQLCVGLVGYSYRIVLIDEPLGKYLVTYVATLSGRDYLPAWLEFFQEGPGCHVWLGLGAGK